MHEEEMNFGKTVMAALAAVLLFIGMFIVTSPAFADDETVLLLVTEYEQEETRLGDEPIWVVSFSFEGVKLSFYADTPYNGDPIAIEIFNEEEVLDAQYILLR